MPVYSYEALDARGQAAKGVVTADAHRAAVDQVLSRGLYPVKVSEQAEAQGLSLASLTGKRISPTAAETFTRELGHLLAAGVPLSRALQLLSREASSPAARKAWEEVRDEVTGGASLAQAMSRFPQAFSRVNIAMVKAGEQGGFLEIVLAQIADLRSRERDLMGRVKAAMVYPVILMTLMTAVVIFLLTYFIPKFSSMFEDFGAALPKLTQVIVFASDLVRDYGLVVAVGIAGLVVLCRRLMQTEAGRRQFEHLLLKTPGIGQVSARFALVRFTRMLGTLLGAGVPLTNALRTARDALGNQTLYDAVSDAIDQVQEGAALSRSLASCPALFSPSTVEMIAIAEETGRLDVELVRIANVNETELDRRLRLLVAALEPLMLMVMASVVGTIVVGMLLPIFTLQDLIK